MKIKSIHEITIKELADFAQLDRRTFYRHFKSKEDIIIYGIQKGAKDYGQLWIGQDQSGIKPDFL